MSKTNSSPSSRRDTLLTASLPVSVSKLLGRPVVVDGVIGVLNSFKVEVSALNVHRTFSVGIPKDKSKNIYDLMSDSKEQDWEIREFPSASRFKKYKDPREEMSLPSVSGDARSPATQWILSEVVPKFANSTYVTLGHFPGHGTYKITRGELFMKYIALSWKNFSSALDGDDPFAKVRPSQMERFKSKVRAEIKTVNGLISSCGVMKIHPMDPKDGDYVVTVGQVQLQLSLQIFPVSRPLDSSDRKVPESDSEENDESSEVEF